MGCGSSRSGVPRGQRDKQHGSDGVVSVSVDYQKASDASATVQSAGQPHSAASTHDQKSSASSLA